MLSADENMGCGGDDGSCGCSGAATTPRDDWICGQFDGFVRVIFASSPQSVIIRLLFASSPGGAVVVAPAAVAAAAAADDDDPWRIQSGSGQGWPRPQTCGTIFVDVSKLLRMFSCIHHQSIVIYISYLYYLYVGLCRYLW